MHKPEQNAPAAEAPKKELKKHWILAALMLTMSLAAMDGTIVATAIPQIVGDLGGFSLFSWLFSIYLLIQTITIPVYGKLADIYGRKPIILFGIIVFMIGSAACGSAQTMITLILYRGVQAFGAGAIVATVNTIAGDIYTIRERAKVQGWLSSVWGVSAIVGPALGGFFAEYVTWRWIFFMNIPFGLASIWLIITFFFEEKPELKVQVDWSGAAAMLVTGTVVMFGLLQSGTSWPWISYYTLGIFLTGLVLIIITVRIERRAAEPILPGWVWSRRVLLGANLATMGMGIAMMASDMFLPVFAQSVTGVNAIAAGFILASMSITWPLASSASGSLYLKIGFRNTALFGTFFILLGGALFFFMGYPGPIWLLVLIQLILGAGFGLISTPMIVGVQSTVHWGQRGVVTGTNMFARYFGQSLGAVIFAAIFNGVLRNGIKNAPAALQAEMPGVNDVVEVLQTNKELSEVNTYLKEIFFNSTHQVYAAMFVIGVLTLIALLLTPAKFPVVED